jgi:hypothetical protein
LRTDERGAVLLEAVVIIPVLLLLTFGMIEFGIGFNQKSAIESASRAGARFASAETAVDNLPGDPVYPVPHTRIGVDAANDINDALSGSSVNQVTDVYVYRIPGDGTPSGFNGVGNACGPSCIHFTQDPAHHNQVLPAPADGSWGTDDGSGNSTRVACVTPVSAAAGHVPDRVGVTIAANFTYDVPGFQHNTISIDATAKFQLEPTNCS